MTNQANEIRQLLLRQRRQEIAPPPYMTAIIGCDAGVGATTVAIGVALGLATEGQRTVLADADLENGDAALRCGIIENESIAAIVDRRCDIHEILQPGPAGMLIAPGCRGNCPEIGESESQELITSLQSLGRHADIVLVDVGRHEPTAASFWKVVDEVVLVASPDSASLMNAYDLVSNFGGRHPEKSVSVFVNKTDEQPGIAAWQRMNRACGRFLKREIKFFGSHPEDSMLTQSAKNWNLERPVAPSRMSFKQLAAQLAEKCERRRRQKRAV